MSRQSVAVVAFDRISPFHLSVPCLVFDQECYDPCAQAFDLRVCAAEPGRLRTTVGFTIEAEAGLEALAEAQTVIVPSWRDPHERPPQALLDALIAARARGAQLVGLCLGAFVLAEAGLLDGRRATTHWMWAEDFAGRFPAVRVEPDVLYIEDDGLLTSAGTVAGIDCCLHLVRQRLGAQTANHLARRRGVAPHRQGGQAQFIEQPLPDSAQDGRLGELLVWLRQNLDQAHSLDSLAQRVLMSRRTFTRHFRQLTGTTVSQWLQAERLALAQRLLETTEHSVQAIAGLAGFGSAVSLRQQLSAAVGLPPLGYRRAFAS
ncbi:helix-turn-helix domain-containing protein [Pseudomonas aeruginosa]|nr:helix-turn-helix domain-containing protein [Pseudomonas aeruginosa]